jgi:hypothetical protein
MEGHRRCYCNYFGLRTAYTKIITAPTRTEGTSGIIKPTDPNPSSDTRPIADIKAILQVIKRGRDLLKPYLESMEAMLPTTPKRNKYENIFVEVLTEYIGSNIK